MAFSQTALSGTFWMHREIALPGTNTSTMPTRHLVNQPLGPLIITRCFTLLIANGAHMKTAGSRTQLNFIPSSF